jgi:hypothetical protein
VHDVLVRKAQEKAAADVEAFKAQQRRAVAATVDTQRAQKDAADAANAAVRQPRAISCRARVRALRNQARPHPHPRALTEQACVRVRRRRTARPT